MCVSIAYRAICHDLIGTYVWLEYLKNDNMDGDRLFDLSVFI